MKVKTSKSVGNKTVDSHCLFRPRLNIKLFHALPCNSKPLPCIRMKLHQPKPKVRPKPRPILFAFCLKMHQIQHQHAGQP